MNEIEIIAEIGVNHNGDAALARKLIDAAKEAGCDTVKFQLWNTERVYAPHKWEEMKRLELSRGHIAGLKEYTEAQRLRFLCTPDDLDDALFLRELGCTRIKIGSSNITNRPLLDAVSTFGIHVILSTGACSLREMIRAAQCFPSSRLTILHCVSCYPTLLADMNLNAFRGIRHHLPGTGLGLSDHTVDYLAALISLGYGARTFEKHLTFPPLPGVPAGPDYMASVTPAEMREYVDALREGATALGDGKKQVQPCERENRQHYEEFVSRQIRGNNAHGPAPASRPDSLVVGGPGYGEELPSSVD